MQSFKNVVITGMKQAGKSTLALWLLEQLNRPYAGFQTVKSGITPAGPLYVIREITSGQHQPISRLQDGMIRGLSETFDTFGTALILRAVLSDAPVLLLDEIGRFERTSESFLSALFTALDSEKTVIAVLKKEDLPYIQKIKSRKDTLLIDLDEISRQSARMQLETHWLQTKRQPCFL